MHFMITSCLAPPLADNSCHLIGACVHLSLGGRDDLDCDEKVKLWALLQHGGGVETRNRRTMCSKQHGRITQVARDFLTYC